MHILDTGVNIFHKNGNYAHMHTWNHREFFIRVMENSLCCLTQRDGDPPSFIDRDSDSHKLSY